MFQFEQNVQINAEKIGENDSSECQHKCSSTLCNNRQLNQFRFRTTLASLRLPPLLACFLQISPGTGCLSEQGFNKVGFHRRSGGALWENEREQCIAGTQLHKKFCSSSTQCNYCILICESLVVTVRRIDGGCVELGYAGVGKWHGFPFDCCRHQSYNSGRCRFKFVWIRLTWP